MGAFDIKVRVVVRTKVLCVLTAALTERHKEGPQLPEAARVVLAEESPLFVERPETAGGRALAPSPPPIGFAHSPYFEAVAVIKLARC